MSYAPSAVSEPARLAPLNRTSSLMHSDSGHTTSVWMATTEVPQFQPLTQDMRVNVCIVGAGIAGLTTAYLLARAGRAVVVIDDGPIGGGETGRTTAHLTAALTTVTTTSRSCMERRDR